MFIRMVIVLMMELFFYDFDHCSFGPFLTVWTAYPLPATFFIYAMRSDEIGKERDFELVAAFPAAAGILFSLPQHHKEHSPENQK